MLRRQARERREYIYRKEIEARRRLVQEKRQKVKRALEEGRPIPSELRATALDVQQDLDWLGDGAEGVSSHADDEYRWAGVEDPKVMVTTSRDPSVKLKMFAKELKLIVPNAQRMNRGHFDIKQLVQACRANAVTDFIIVHEHRGTPDGLIISHLPYGPTAYFTLTNVVTRHDIPDVGKMSEQYPHLIVHNFGTKLGVRVSNILKYLFPVPKADSKRVITFANQDDYISFRHHTYKRHGADVELTEVGPRFEMKPYCIKLGTLESIDTADTEWVLKPYMNTGGKRQFLAQKDVGQSDDED